MSERRTSQEARNEPMSPKSPEKQKLFNLSASEIVNDPEHPENKEPCEEQEEEEAQRSNLHKSGSGP